MEPNIPPKKPRLLDQVRDRLRYKHYSLSTEKLYVYWIRFFIRWSGLRHPSEMGALEVESFLTMLAAERQVSPSTHKQALCALLFLYKQFLKVEFPWMDDLHRPTRPPRLPTVLTQIEVKMIFAEMKGTHALMAHLLYGTGMRMMELMMLRVKDVDFGRREITIRFGKGGKDRRTVLPLTLVAPLKQHVESVRAIYDADRAAQRNGVMLPDALARKYTNAATQWAWFWVFPSDIV